MNKTNYTIIPKVQINKYKRLQKSIEETIKESKNMYHSKVLINWIDGKIIPLNVGNKQDIILEVGKNNKYKCSKCDLKGLYKLGDKFYCWSHVYLINTLNNMIEKN